MRVVTDIPIFMFSLNRKHYSMSTSIDIRQRTFAFALEILSYCREIQNEHKEYILTKQLSRSATSVGANIREARNAESKADFIHKMSIAQKECDESLYWLELLGEFIPRESESANRLHLECSQLLKIIRTIILRSKENHSWKKR
jgi:four helix bundle protein